MPEYIYRRNAVTEALNGRRHLHKLYIQDKLPRKEANPFYQLARQRKLPVEQVSKQRLGNLAKDGSHQGVVLEAAAYPYADVDDMLALAAQRNELPLLLVMDLVQGPQNVGMLVRSAESFGAHGIIMQDRRAPDITPAMVAASAGATEHILIAKVTNINQTLRQLKKNDVWVLGTEMNAPDFVSEVDLNRPIALIIGHEGSGMRRQVRDNCDLFVKIPMRGQVESLNAAVSGSIVLYEAWRSRGFNK